MERIFRQVEGAGKGLRKHEHLRLCSEALGVGNEAWSLDKKRPLLMAPVAAKERAYLFVDRVMPAPNDRFRRHALCAWLGFGAGVLLGNLCHSRKGGGIMHGQVGQHLAVDGDIANAQPFDQARIGNAIEPRGGIDARDPEPAEIALAISAVAVCIHERAHHRFVRALVESIIGRAVTFHLREHFLVPPVSSYASLDSCHLLLRTPMVSRGLAAVREHALDALHVRFAHFDRAIELALHARGLAATEVRLHTLGRADLPGGCEGEPPLGALMRFQLLLRHDSNCLPFPVSA